jgi:hypothetical protein
MRAHILTTLTLSNITSNFLKVAMVANVNIQIHFVHNLFYDISPYMSHILGYYSSLGKERYERES